MATKEDVRKLNRPKVVLAEIAHIGKLIAEQLGKDSDTVTKWYTNTFQPDLSTF